MIKHAFDLLATVPTIVWSGIMASLLTLGGVMLSNRSNTNRLKLQLKHDSQEKSKERQANLRREVYLRAAEEIVKAGNHLGTIPQIDPIKESLAAGLDGYYQTAAKLQLIASTETANLVGELTARYTEVLFKLITKAKPMHDLKIEINLCNDFYDRSNAEVNRILAEMTQYNESATNDPRKFASLQESFSNFQSITSEYAKQREEHWKNHNLLNNEYASSLLDEMVGISEMQILVTAAIRKELELETDYEKMKINSLENKLRLQGYLDSFLSKIK